MAISPGQYNFSLQRRADHSITLEFDDSTGASINLTSWTVAAQVWNQDRSTKYADFTVTYTNRATGTFTTADAEEFTEALAAGLLDEIYSLE